MLFGFFRSTEEQSTEGNDFLMSSKSVNVELPNVVSYLITVWLVPVCDMWIVIYIYFHLFVRCKMVIQFNGYSKTKDV